MKPIFSRITNIITAVESTPLSLSLWTKAFLSLIVIRFAIESALEKFPERNFSQIFFQFTHLLLFFLLSYLLLLPLVQSLGKVSLAKAAKVLLCGFTIMLFPPIIDKILFGNNLYWSFYIFDSLSALPLRFITFFGKDPHIGITYGVRAEVALVLIGLFVYGYIKTRDSLRSISLVFLAYTLLFILGTLPSWLSYIFLIHEYPLFSITHIHIAEIFLSPESILGRTPSDLHSVLSQKMSLLLIPSIILTLGILWFKNAKTEFLSLLANIRFPQIVYHAGLFSVGMLLAKVYSGTTFSPSLFSAIALFVAWIALTLAWLTTVIHNDLSDQPVDALTNTTRPLITGTVSKQTYTFYGTLLFWSSLLTAALIDFRFPLFILVYFALAHLYSVPPFRLKRFLGIATFLASLASMTLLVLGYTLGHPSRSLTDFPLSLLLYLTISYALIIPLKDFKDILGDKKDGTKTLPVILGEERAKIVMSSIAFLIFMSSIFVMHTPELLLWAFLFGSAAFWIISHAKPKGRFSYRNLASIFMILATIYGCGVVFFLL